MGPKVLRSQTLDLEMSTKLLCREIQNSICKTDRLYPGHAWKGPGKGKHDERSILFSLTEANFHSEFPNKGIGSCERQAPHPYMSPSRHTLAAFMLVFSEGIPTERPGMKVGLLTQL